MIDRLIELKSSFSFGEPQFLSLLIPFAFLFLCWLFIAGVRIKRRPEITFGSKHPLVGKFGIWFFTIIAGVLAVLALARPYLTTGAPGLSKGNVDVVIVIDRSISMRANDIGESRLEISKREALAIEGLLREGDRVGLFIFGRESHRKIHLTRDFSSVFERISRISFPAPGNLSGDGLIWDSDFASVLENIYLSVDRQDMGVKKISMNKYTPEKRSNRVVILITDGEDQFRRDRPTDSGEITYRNEYLRRLNLALREFKKRGLEVYPLGIGTFRGVSWISLLRGYKEGSDYSEKVTADWKGRMTRLDKENLMFLARSTDADLAGHIWTIENVSSTSRSYLRYVLDSHRQIMPTLEVSVNDDSQLWQEFLLVAVAVLSFGIISYPFTGYRQRKKALDI